MIRILAISIGVLGAVGLSIIVLRAIGLHQPIVKDTSKIFRNTFEIVAHRGGSLEAPENTLAAFANAAEIASDIIFEFDVHLSKDGAVVVIHDGTLERTTNGLGKVSDFTLEELKKLDAGYNYKNSGGEFSWRGKGVRIPTLQEVLQSFPNRMVIELKDETEGIENKVAQIIREAKADDRIIIGAQKGTLIARFRALEPTWSYSASRDDVLRAIMLQSLFLEPMGSWPANAFLIPEKDGNIKVLSQTLIDELHRRGKKVLIWTVNDESDMKRLKSLGVNGLITDRPSVAYKLKSL